MANLREAIQHARGGGTSRYGGKVIRFLDLEEATEILRVQSPSRRTVIGENGKPIVRNGQIVVEEYVDPSYDTKRLGLYDVSGAVPVEYAPSAEDAAAAWLREGIDDAPPPPEVISPEAVDEVLAENEEPQPIP